MAFEKYINKQLKSKYMQVKVVIIPTSRKHLLEDLNMSEISISITWPINILSNRNR